ncbi:MAG: adenylate/guanylate cyclase domain-containing protein [Proteobacteria bacterium]|nr:adenylate/guanylate cyclase domain-containing protein [Pseudomonadota bacterium]
MQRRLAAIVHADLAGFTRMMESGETRTFRHLKTAQNEVWRPAIVAGGGRLVGTAGDAMLAEFGSPVAAVSAAIDIQERMTAFNRGLDEAQRLMFRIGVHLGEVIVDEEDQNIFGDGVNLAARIQTLAEPGGIAVSRAVRDLAEIKVDYAFVDGGEHTPKNVSRPVHIYHVRASDRPARPGKAAVLRFEGGVAAGQKFAFDVPLATLKSRPGGMMIGRAADQCDLVLPHGTVSRRHARLVLGTAGVEIEDEDSTNGTSVNGVALRAGTPAVVRPGDRVRIGDVEFGIKQV